MLYYQNFYLQTVERKRQFRDLKGSLLPFWYKTLYSKVTNDI